MANQIQELTLEEVMGDRFGRYSKYIIQERALPDVRDGLKPVQRRILFAMNQDGNTYDKGFRKSAKSVGNVMGNYHPHGDSSIYEAMVRLSQDWKLRAPLIQMHGNNGSMDGDPPAAMRYTEARLSKISKEMLADIDKETVDMVLNFDDTAQEPTVLPAGFPNLLVNGATGISAGYATEIPPHNLREVVNAILYLLKHPQADLADLMQYVKGPDFPTGGIIQGLDGIKQAYETGRGKIVVRSRTHIETIRGGREKIVVTEIPYDVNKAQMIKKIDELRLNKKVDGIAEVRDESDRFGLSVVIELKKEADAHGILNYLFKNTDLQITYNFNMVAIADMQPKLLGLKAMLEAYVAHRRDVVTRRTRYELNKAQARQHIVEGLIKMLSILDQVIAAIRASSDKGDAKRNLVKQFDFSEAQAEAIVSLQLYRLTNTDITALQDEAAQLAKAIAEYQDILAQPASRDRVIEKELKRIAKEYGDDRRSSIQAEIETLEVATTVTVADETVMVQVSRDGYVKRSSLRSYQAVDPEDNGLKPNDLAIFTGELSTLQHLYIVTNAGNIIYRPVYEISDARWKDTGEHLSQTVGLGTDEKVLAVFAFDQLDLAGTFVLGSSDGYIKQTALSDLQPQRTYKRKPMMAMKLKTPGAVVTNAYFTTDQAQDVFVVSRHAYGLGFPLAEVSTVGARATGVKSMDLKPEDEVVNFILVKQPEKAVVGILTQRGAFKRMALSEVGQMSRARRGLLVLRELKRDPHRIVAMMQVDDNTRLDVLTDADKVVTLTPVNHPTGDRYSNGSFVIDTDVQGKPVFVRTHEETPVEP
ncbi:DNA topoisomerase IV subunit A [Lacticaseibacillus rhamnosus]|uniref:DNA topoisomerase IV subunit A n=1 Tax=Lacticaseibacillus rhamnosus TaxID=47715 RepID=UPI000235A87D|nr:DNA topoisomerase IV subunit A [Lacticaseibacillus rhamnosus]OFT15667.1 DNA topoisomerase IV subunit A [Lactobacillus sp. HMSC17G08]AGP71201.1 Topoisomerase IV subunit A [Lacticaseibacillus rhamnosus LOCK900]ARD32411.1 DNA topoisomerase IV subunit A [Lacticaseibacillus rhamnosus]EHJ24071.1 DNA topoisomerase IV subunit A [Lacticaseibacillus rhamnosus R0011]EHJ34194.1 DNA topoisomerase IV, A subunit [Lacticaseibacillus rhamnosus ATCC 21052]